jgi:hypothetical protein
MSVIKLEPKNKKPDLKVNYLGTEYVLPGAISALMLEKMMDAQEAGGDSAFLSIFLKEVVPAEFKKVLPYDDMAELANLWLEHIQGPKDSGSKE